MAEIIELDDFLASLRVSIMLYPMIGLDVLIDREIGLKAKDFRTQQSLLHEICDRQLPLPNEGGPSFPSRPFEGTEGDTRGYLAHSLAVYFEEQATTQSFST